MNHPLMRGQSAADLEALDRLNIMAEWAANKGLGRVTPIMISVGDLLDLREALSGHLGKGFPLYLVESPGVRALRALSAELEQILAHEDLSRENRARIQRWYEMTGEAIGRELHWRSDVRDVLDAGLAYAQEEEKVKPRHLRHERRLLGALFRLLDRQ